MQLILFSFLPRSFSNESSTQIHSYENVPCQTQAKNYDENRGELTSGVDFKQKAIAVITG